MRIFVQHERKDGKFKVVYTYSNGVRLAKIVTRAQIEADRAKEYEVIGLSLSGRGCPIHYQTTEGCEYCVTIKDSANQSQASRNDD